MSWAEDVTTGGRVTVRDVLVDAERRLASAGVPSPSNDAAEIVSFVLGTSRSRLFLQDVVTDEQKIRIEQVLARRLLRQPLQHLTGSGPFRYIDLSVGPGVFTPRPETELVAEAAIRELTSLAEGDRIAVDLCAGSGAIAISVATEVAASRVHAVELSDDAIAWTRQNAGKYASAIRDRDSMLDVIHHDATTVAEPGAPLARLAERAAVVVSNPPYIPEAMVPREPEVRDHEPAVALYGGRDGMDVIRGIVRTAAILLRRGGLLVIEHADVQGGPDGVPGVIRDLVADADLSLLAHIPVGQPAFVEVVDRPDLNGLPRFTMARRAGA